MKEFIETKCLLSPQLDEFLKKAAKEKRLSKTAFVSLSIEDILYRKFRTKKENEK